MSETGEDQNDKPYEATRRKLEEARKKGEIVRSQDVISLVAFKLYLVFHGMMLLLQRCKMTVLSKIK